MIIDKLYTAIRDRILDADPAIGIRMVDWHNGQPDDWEQGNSKQEPLRLPCALVRLEAMEWQMLGQRKTQCDAIVYIDVVQLMVRETLASDRGAGVVATTRATYDLVQAVNLKLITLAGDGHGPLKKVMMEMDHAYQRLRVDTIAYKTRLYSNDDIRQYVPAWPTLVVNPGIGPRVRGDFNADFANDFFQQG